MNSLNKHHLIKYDTKKQKTDTTKEKEKEKDNTTKELKNTNVQK